MPAFSAVRRYGAIIARRRHAGGQMAGRDAGMTITPALVSALSRTALKHECLATAIRAVMPLADETAHSRNAPSHEREGTISVLMMVPPAA